MSDLPTIVELRVFDDPADLHYAHSREPSVAEVIDWLLARFDKLEPDHLRRLDDALWGDREGVSDV